MQFTIQRLTEHDAAAIIGWRYDPPYDFYDMSTDAIGELLDSQQRYVAVTDRGARLVGFACFGESAQVPGGHRAGLHSADPEALDLGLGLTPELTGRGLGLSFVAAVLDYGRAQFLPRRFRLSVATFNQRAIRVYQRAGFAPGPGFTSPVKGVEVDFLLMTL